MRFTVAALLAAAAAAAPATLLTRVAIPIMSPNSDTVVTVGRPFMIKWQTAGTADKNITRIELMHTADGSTVLDEYIFAGAMENNGSLMWMPQTPAAGMSQEYYILISDEATDVSVSEPFTFRS